MFLMPLILTSFVAWFISTLAGGGSPIVLIPLVNFMLGPLAVAPVITTGMLVGNSQRIGLFWRDINWTVNRWYFPGAIAGAVLGAYTFTHLDLEWLQLLIGVFLVISIVGFCLKKKQNALQVRDWHFLPGGFFYAFISGAIGSSGPLLNPLYLKYGLVKEEMIATKASHVVVIHVAKMLTYFAFGALTPQYLLYGLAIGLAALPANLLGRYVLRKMNENTFRQIVFASMAIAGVLMVWEQRSLIGLQ